MKAKRKSMNILTFKEPFTLKSMSSDSSASIRSPPIIKNQNSDKKKYSNESLVSSLTNNSNSSIKKKYNSRFGRLYPLH